MKNILQSILLCTCITAATACTKSSYEIAEPKPSLEVTVLQTSYVIDEPIYVQLKASQRGYTGAFHLSVILNEGAGTMSMNGAEVAASGEWVTMTNASEIITITPTQAGILKLSFEVKSGDDMVSGRSTINLKVSQSTALALTADAPQSVSIKDLVEINVAATKKGFSGKIITQFEQLANKGSLQFGAVTVASGEKFSIPANSPQTLYYTPSERGVHKLQLSATDGYTTEFKVLEIIVTN